MSDQQNIEELIALYGMLSRMRTMSSGATVSRAERALVETTNASPNRTRPFPS